MRWQPAIRTVPPYFDNPAHIEALALSLEETDGPARRSAGYAALAAAWTRAGATLDALLNAPATLLHDNKQGDT